MNDLKILLLVPIIASLFQASAPSQIQSQTTATLPLTGLDTKTALIPGNSAATFLDQIVDPPVSGDFLDILPTNPAVVISLVQPNSIEVTAANAASLGFTWTVTTGTGTKLSPFAAPGTHITIGIPPSAAAGVYRIKANSQGIATDSAMSVTYMSQSGTRTGIIPGAGSYRAGETVVLTAPVFNGTTPLTTATVTARITPANDVSLQTTIGNYTLVSTTAVDATTSNYVYQATLTNSGPELGRGTAGVESTSPEVRVIDPGLVFGPVSSGGSVPSVDTFTLQRKNSVPFDPAVLRWTMLATGNAVNVPLTDSGQFDAAPNDGLYTGAYTPTAPGEYSVVSTVTGTSGGAQFSRKASTSFKVIAPMAAFVTFQDQGIDDNANGLLDRIVTTATITVTSPGEYDFFFELQASNGKTLSGANRVQLAAGQQQIPVTFRSRDIYETLGVSGPYQRMRARLVRKEQTISTLADSRIDAGSTAAYALSSLDRGSLYLAGNNSAAGVITSGGPLFDLLRAQAGVYTGGGQCSWHGGLMSGGLLIDFASGSATLPPGVTLMTLDFSGKKISRSGRNGPYSVKDFGVKCGSSFVSAPTLMLTPGYAASQFVAGATDFSVSVTPSTLAIGIASSGLARVALDTTGLFEPLVHLAVSGLPSGVTAHFPSASADARIPTAKQLFFQAAPTAVAGTYPVTIQATGGGLVRNSVLSLQITPRSGYAVGASPIGPAFTVDGSKYMRARTFPWFPSSIHSLEVASPQMIGQSRYTFLNWSDGLPMSHQITAPPTVTDYVANFFAEHTLTLLANPPSGGSITPASGSFHAQGSNVNLTATPNPGFQFQHWTGAVDNPSSPTTTVSMTSSKNVTANFVPLPATIGLLFVRTSFATLPHRLWYMIFVNFGPGAAYNAELVSFTMTHVSGPPCTPVLRTPLPAPFGDTAPKGNRGTYHSIYFDGCTTDSRFNINYTIRANDGAATLTQTHSNTAP